ADLHDLGVDSILGKCLAYPLSGGCGLGIRPTRLIVLGRYVEVQDCRVWGGFKFCVGTRKDGVDLGLNHWRISRLHRSSGKTNNILEEDQSFHRQLLPEILSLPLAAYHSDHVDVAMARSFCADALSISTAATRKHRAPSGPVGGTW